MSAGVVGRISHENENLKGCQFPDNAPDPSANIPYNEANSTVLLSLKPIYSCAILNVP